MKKPVVRVALGQQLQEARVARGRRAAARRPRVVRLDPARVLAERRPRPPRSRGPRSCRSSRRASPPGRERPGGADQQPALQRGEALGVARAPCASARRGARRAFRGLSRAGPRGCDRSPIRGRPRSRRRPRPVTQVTPARAHSASISAARRGSSSTETSSPRSPIRAAIAVVLIPGPAQRSSTRSPGCGSSSATTACEPRDWGTSSPVADPRAHRLAGASRRPGSRPDRAARPLPARSTSTPAARRSAATVAGSARSVLTRKAVSAGSFIAAISSRASASPSSSHHSSASHTGYEWAIAAPAGVESSSAASSSSRSAAARRRIALTKPLAARARPAPPVRRIPCLASSTAWSTAA